MNFRDRFIISIVDNNGIKQFNFHKLIKKIAAFSILFLLITSILIFFIIKLLAFKLKDLQLQKSNVIEKYVSLYNKNEVLKQQIDISQNKLESINQKMTDLEDIINSKDVITDYKYTTPFNIENLDSNKRLTMLKIIPSGLPINDENHTKTNSKNGVSIAIKSDLPVYATADGIIDFTRDEETLGIGRFVKVIHSFGFTSIYGNLSKTTLKRGDIVSKGDLIGYSSSKKELFYDVRFLGIDVNVNDFINWNINNFSAVFTKVSVVNWDSLIWTFDDMMKINDHKVFLSSKYQVDNENR